jgi:hypothetical protein
LSGIFRQNEPKLNPLILLGNGILMTYGSLKHQWIFLHSLDSVTTVRRLVAFYVEQHNRVLPHSAFQGQTPDEMYFGTGDAVPEDLLSRAAAARRTRVEANRSASCEICPSAVRDRMTMEC